jgi:hypothetical protein
VIGILEEISGGVFGEEREREREREREEEEEEVGLSGK